MTHDIAENKTNYSVYRQLGNNAKHCLVANLGTMKLIIHFITNGA